MFVFIMISRNFQSVQTFKVKEEHLRIVNNNSLVAYGELLIATGDQEVATKSVMLAVLLQVVLELRL